MSWYYVENGQRMGPLAQEGLAELAAAGRVGAETLVWSDGMAGWQPYRTVAPDGSALEPGDTCSECGQSLPGSELFRYGASRVCATCKPLFLQKLREGIRPTTGMRYAEFGTRFGAKLLDGVLLWIVNMALTFAFIAPMMKRVAVDKGGLPAGFLGLQILMMAIQMSINAAYVIFFLGRYGATLGKLALKLRVVNADGSPIGYGKAAARYLAEFLSSLTLLIGYLMAAWDDEKRALHDRICNTRVVRI